MLIAVLFLGLTLGVTARPETPRGVVGAKKFATAIDCNGVVAFSSAGARPQGSGKGPAKLGYATELTDKGVGWSRDSGEFTCFCPGLYQFAFSGSGDRNTKLALKKKASSSDTWSTIVSTGPGGGSNIALLDMDIGDQAAIWLEDGELHQEKDAPSCAFNGFRIAKKP
ncbi:complement C1q-like protein 4 [Anabrus simplex]|uniref:complement C1q-like protein 4 n=1 Tax=Anabrus simplex TaxID=316456 RepID=UPI0034DD4C1F